MLTILPYEGGPTSEELVHIQEKVEPVEKNQHRLRGHKGSTLEGPFCVLSASLGKRRVNA